MKDLNDVIKAAECCADVTSCSRCPYYDNKEKLMGCMDKNFGRNNFINDALFHLRHYKAMKLGIKTEPKTKENL